MTLIRKHKAQSVITAVRYPDTFLGISRKMFHWRTCNIDIPSILPKLAKSQKAVNELSCSCQYFWSLLAYQHMFDASQPHQHPPSIYQ